MRLDLYDIFMWFYTSKLAGYHEQRRFLSKSRGKLFYQQENYITKVNNKGTAHSLGREYEYLWGRATLRRHYASTTQREHSWISVTHCNEWNVCPSTFHLHSNTWIMSADTFTPSYVLFHPFMLNLLFAYPIYLINTNVDPITHPYYANFENLEYGLPSGKISCFVRVSPVKVRNQEW